MKNSIISTLKNLISLVLLVVLSYAIPIIIFHICSPYSPGIYTYTFDIDKMNFFDQIAFCGISIFTFYIIYEKTAIGRMIRSNKYYE